MDRGLVVDVVYLDFSKAFDVVSHQVLLEKLCSLGFDGLVLGWIRSFLVDRRMSVLVNGAKSSLRHVTSGVPQGSVLGPILFLVYVNFVTAGLGCQWTAFADDFKLCICYPRGRSEESTSAQSNLQRCIDDLAVTSKSWNLSLNPAKCVVIRFGGGREDVSHRSPYTLEGANLEYVKSHRDLGVVVDDSLRFHIHINSVVRKAGALMGNLLRATKCRAREFMVTLFVSHVRPIIDYCSCVWNVGYLGDVRRLESLQRRWTKEVEGLRGMEYVVRLRECGLFSVGGRLLRQDLVKIWKSFHVEVEVGMGGLFERAAALGTRGHQYKLSVPVCRSEVRRRSLAARCVSVWNSLSADTVEASGLVAFKRRLDADLGDRLFAVS